MPQLSPRVTDMNDQGSDGWEVFARARAMVEQGIPVTELTIGEHDIRTAPAILDAMHAAAHAGHTGYATVPGITPLRQAIATRVTQRTGVPTKVENVLVTPGGQAALFAAHLTTLQPGDAALYVDPYYVTYPGTLRACSARPVAIPTTAENSFFPTKGALDTAAQTPGAKTLLINTPNNPTGTIYPRAVLENIAQTCRDHDLWLISDEVYDTQTWEGDHLSPRALPGMAERTIVIGSMSKSHAMTGSRIGWIFAPPHVIEALSDLAVSTTYGVPGYIQDAALYALTQGPDLEQEIAEPFRRRRALALDVLARQGTVGVIPSQGAMYLMLDIRKTGLSGQDFANRLLDSHHIAVMPGESFGISAAGHLRIALTVNDDRLLVALETLCTFAQSLTRA